MFKRIEYKYLVGVVFVFGLFMDLLDMTITNVALPRPPRECRISASTPPPVAPHQSDRRKSTGSSWPSA